MLGGRINLTYLTGLTKTSLLIAASLYISESRGAGSYSEWNYSREIFLNTTPTGANIQGDQIGFPLLISLTALQADIFKDAANSGADLRFSKSDGTPLSYQVDTWNALEKKASVWVRLDTLRGNNASQSIRIYWGNPKASDNSDGKMVFRTENGFKGVWHLGASLEDATSNQNHGVDSGTTLTEDGRIGQARLFKNPNSYATSGNYIYLGAKPNLQFTGAITFEAWVRWNRRDNHRIILCHGGAVGYPSETVLRIGEFLDYRTGVWNGTQHHAMVAAPSTDSMVWIQLTGTFTGSGWNLYRNGVLAASTALDTNGAQASPAGWRIGAEYIGQAISRYYSGSLDEVRLSNITRSASWIKANYENQKVDQTMVVIGPTTTSLKLNRNANPGNRQQIKITEAARKQTVAFPRKKKIFDAQGHDLGAIPK